MAQPNTPARWAAPGCCAWPEGDLWRPMYLGLFVGPAVSDVELALAIAEAAMDEGLTASAAAIENTKGGPKWQ